MKVYLNLVLIFLIYHAKASDNGRQKESNSESSKDFNTFLFDVGLHEEVKTQEFSDRRRYDWLMSTCDFSTVNDTDSQQCNFGSLDKKWYVFYGATATAVRDKDDNRPVYPSLGFWSEKEKSATLYSDPVPCLKKGSASNIHLNLWVRGLWKFQICFLHMKNGTEIKCGSSISSRNLVMHKMRLEEPFPDYVTDSDVGPTIVSLRATIKNGVILVDDIEITGVHCRFEDENVQPISTIDVRDYKLVNEETRNELLAPITKKVFTKYLQTIVNHHSSSLSMLPAGHICELRCRDNDFICVYDTNLGTVPWTFEQRRIMDKEKKIAEKSMYVAKFPPNLHGYAILTSGKLNVDSGSLKPDMLFTQNKGKFQFTFTYNNAACKRKILVCHHSHDPTSYKCKRVIKNEDEADQDWTETSIFIPHNNIDMVQIVVIQNRLFNEDETDEVIIRDIHIKNCIEFDG